MYIQAMMVKGRKYYQVRENFWADGRCRQRVIIHLGTHPTIEAAFLETEEHYFAARKGRGDDPLTATDQKMWDRLDRLYEVCCKYKKEAIKLSARHKAEQKRQDAEAKRRFLARPRRIPPWCQAVLGLPGHATPDEIRAARDRKARECHPDHGGSDSAMAAINEAYERLTG